MSRDPETIMRSLVVRDLIGTGKRTDGRSLGQMRPFTVETGVIAQADGSARVRLGGTELVVGVKLMPTGPYPDHPDEGVIHTALQLLPIASPSFDGDMAVEATEIARVVDRGIRHSGMIDMKGLCISPGERVWGLYLDIHVLDHDGNLFDASTLGIALSMKGMAFPNSRFGMGEDVPVPLGEMPVTLTFAKVAGELILDPTAEEEGVSDGRITMSLDSRGWVRALQLGGCGHFTPEEVKRAYRLAMSSAEVVRGSLR